MEVIFTIIYAMIVKITSMLTAVLLPLVKTSEIQVNYGYAILARCGIFPFMMSLMKEMTTSWRMKLIRSLTSKMKTACVL